MSTEISHYPSFADRTPDIYKDVDPKETNDGAHLSNYVFANPSDFLNVLEKVMPKVPAHSAAGVDQVDLEMYAGSANDPKEQAAVTLAAEHFDQLLELRSVSRFADGLPSATLSPESVGRLNDMVSGNSSWDKLEDKLSIGSGIALMGVGGLLTGAGSVGAAIEGDVPLAIAAGGLAGAFGVTAAIMTKELLTYDSHFGAKVVQDRAVINSWLKPDHQTKYE